MASAQVPCASRR